MEKIDIAGQIASIILNVPTVAISSLPPPLSEQLSCQLTDPKSQHVECSITSTQPGMANVSYTPTLRGAHQLKITVGDTDIPGSPFTVHVLPSLEMRGVPIKTITGVILPSGLAVSESGEVVISQHRHGFQPSITVFSREGNMIKKFSLQSPYPNAAKLQAAVMIDKQILLIDKNYKNIQLYTMEGEFVKSAGEKGSGPLQFNYPEGIAVHPSSGLVYVADSENHCIQVLRSNLSFLRMFGSHGSGPGQFNDPIDVACDSSGIVYVTDYYNHRVQSFFANGQFISSFGNEGSLPLGRLSHPYSICIDSTDTVYVADWFDCYRVSAFTTSGKFLKSFSSGEGELKFSGRIAVDNTTGNIYVCDTKRHRVVVF